MQPIEAVLSVGMAALATAIAMGSLRVPAELTQSSIMLALFLIVALVLFSYSPVVGIAAIALFAVMVFSRNVQTVVGVNAASAYGNHHRKTNPIPPVYGEQNIYKERHDIQEYDVTASQPREYSKFRDTYSRSFLSSSVEGFEAAPYNYVNEAADGQYPINQNRMTASPAREEYLYEPEAETGSNEFESYGPNLDEKFQSYGY
jgi:uncharacterized short protein YbdD (DUF466 family)